MQSLHRTLDAHYPALLIEIPLEELPLVRILAGTHEDELRLRSWLRGARVLPTLGFVVADMLECWLER